MNDIFIEINAHHSASLVLQSLGLAWNNRTKFVTFMKKDKYPVIIHNHLLLVTVAAKIKFP